MENFDITKFSPEKAALQELANKYTSLTIAGVDDTAGYAIVDEARKDLKKKRVMIANTGKELRKEALDFQKKVISMEKELIGIIEPLELELKAKQDVVDEQKRRALRMAALPARQEKLRSIECMVSDDELLGMSAEEFTEFFQGKNGEYLERKERELKEREEKLSREKEMAAAKEQARLEAEEAAKLEAIRVAEETKAREAQAKKDAEEAQKKAVKLAEEKAEKERRKLVEEQEKKEKARLKAEEDAKQEEQERVWREEEAARVRERDEKYQQFLADNGWTEESKLDFVVEVHPSETILFKKIAVFHLDV